MVVLPFVLWVFCFRGFFTGRLWLEEDALSYADHIRFYIQYLSQGIFPLWDPTWNNGAPNHFFLQRIGDVNPLLFLMIVLKWLGVSLTFGLSYFFRDVLFFSHVGVLSDSAFSSQGSFFRVYSLYSFVVFLLGL